jgi:cysteine desulfurase
LGGLVERIRSTVRRLDGVDVLGDPHERLPHVVTFSCLYVDGESLLTELDREGFAVGSGSACTSGSLEPSRVLAAIGALTHGNVRIALHPGVTSDDVDRFLAVFPQVLDRVRSRLGAPPLR